MHQITDSILMIRPVAFRMNEETAVNNYFQEDLNLTGASINTKAQKEFDVFANKLKAVGVNVIVIDDVLENDTPDSIFPNNWISFHKNGDVVLYPMFADNRRRERREDVFTILENNGFKINNIIDYTAAEESQLFLEGTGSLLLDRVNNIVYCALSDRAHEDLIIEFCEDFEYTPVIFTANQTVNNQRLPIYHTNVMMALAESFAVICLDAIDDSKERKNVIKLLKQSGKEILNITEQQMHQFAGNMLQLCNTEGKKFMAMSTAAHESLDAKQLQFIERHCEILSSDLTTIETCGGGSARCMMAEVFLPR